MPSSDAETSLPRDWDVSLEWEGMRARLHEFGVTGERGWYVFIRHVRNTTTGREWIDGVTDNGFVSFRPGRIARTRARSAVAGG